jgi:hypothetical protein
MGIDFDDLEGLEIRKGSDVGYAVYFRSKEFQEPELLAAFAEVGGIVPWLQRTIEAWEKHAEHTAAAKD